MNINEKCFPLQTYINFSEPAKKLYSIRYLCLNEPICALVFLSSLDKKIAKQIIQSLINSSPPYKELFNSPQLISTPKFQWLCYCVSKTLNIDINFNFLSIFLLILQDDKFYSIISKIFKTINNVYNDKIPNNLNYHNDINLLKKVLITLTTKDFDAIISLSISSPHIFRALSLYFDFILDSIDINKFYNQYGYSLLPIMNIENINIKSVTFNSYPELEDIIQKTILGYYYNNNFIHSYKLIDKNFEFKSTSAFLYNLQNHFFQSNPFPNKTFFGHFSLLYSLLNTSLATKAHFIDIAGGICLELFKENDYKNALDSFSLLPQMKSWAVIAVYNSEENRNNPLFLSEILPLLPQDLKTNISYEFLNRCNNDNKLKLRILQITNNKRADLINHSIPFIFKQCLNTTGPIFDFEEVFQNKLFVYSDEERIKDCNFISYYFAIVNEIKCIIDEKNINEHISNLNKSLSLFSKNFNDHENIMVDMFSLLFLQNNDNKFICSSDTANKILPLLSNYIISDSFLKIFTKSLKKVNISNLIFTNDHKLNHALLPSSSLFDITLISHDWELAQQLENKDKRFQVKRQIFTEVYNFGQIYRTNENIMNEQSLVSLMIAAEIGLSYNDQENYLKIAKTHLEIILSSKTDSKSSLIVSNDPTKMKENANVYYLPDEIKPVLLKRKENPLLEPSMSQEFFSLSNKLLKIKSTNWSETRISKTFQNYKIFCGFFSYLDGFIPVILESKYAENVTEALSVEPDKLIFHLYSQNKIKEVNQVASALKMDIFESMILHSTKNGELKLPFIKEYPIINYADIAFSDTDDDEMLKLYANANDAENSTKYEFNSKLLTKLRSLKKTTFYAHLKKQNQNKETNTKTTSNDKQNDSNKNTNKNDDKINLSKYESVSDLFYVNDVPKQYNEKLLTELVNKSKTKPENNTFIDIEKIADLSFSVSSEFFEDLIQKNLSKFDLQELMKLCNMSNCTDNLAESVEFLNEISKDFKPVFPLENLLTRLLSISALKIASEFCRIFRFQMKTSKVIREFALTLLKRDQSIKDILNVCKPLKNEIIESIPTRFKDKAIRDGDNFFDIIPKHWKRQKGPKTTFIMNLNDDANAYMVFQKLPLFNVDHELLSLIPMPDININSSKITDFEMVDMYSKCLKKLLKFFRNPFEPCQKVLNCLINIVSKINVNENSNELFISVLMHRVHSSIVEATKIIKDFFLTFSTNYTKNQQKKKLFQRFFQTIPFYCEYIRVLSNFVLCFLNTKFGIIYSFNEFQSKQKAAQFMEICFKYDIPTIGIQFMEVWNLSEQSTLIDNYSLILFRLGRFDDGLKMCIDRRMKKSLRTMSIVDQFVDTCSYSQLFDQHSIKKLVEIDTSMLSKYDISSDENKDLSDYISNDLQVNRKTLINSSVWNYIHRTINASESDTENSEQFVFMPIKTSEDSMVAANRYLKLKAPLFMRVKKLVINGNFDKALKLAMKSGNINQSISNNNVKFKLDNSNRRFSTTSVNRGIKIVQINESSDIKSASKEANDKNNNGAEIAVEEEEEIQNGTINEANIQGSESENNNNHTDNKLENNNNHTDNKLENKYTESSNINSENDNNTRDSKLEINDTESNNINSENGNSSTRDNNGTESIMKSRNIKDSNVSKADNDDSTKMLLESRARSISRTMSQSPQARIYNEAPAASYATRQVARTNSSSNNSSNNNNSNNSNSNNSSSNGRNTKIIFGTDRIVPGSPKKGMMNSSLSHQRVMQERFNLFLENIFVVSISYSNFSKMKVKILEFDPKLHFFGSLVEKLLQYAMHNSMPHLKFELEMFLGRTDSAVVTSISLYRESKSISDLENALKAVKKDLSSRRENTKTAPSSLDIDVIESYAKIIPLQISFMKFVHQKNATNNNENDLEYNKSLSLFNGKKSAISIVIVLFRQFNFSLALEIINTCGLNLLQIADALCDVIYNERNSSMMKLVRSLEDSFPDDIFMTIVNRILFRLYYVIDEGNEVGLKIIENALNNEEFRTKLFIQFGEFEKAFENAKKWKLYSLMPLIAHEALSKDPGNQSYQIVTSISSMLSRVQRSGSAEF